MMQTELLQKNLALVGEEISHELGAQMVKDYQVANPTDVKSYLIGRNILEQLLAQPGCVGIRFYNAYNEEGDKTLVYTGVDEAGKSIFEYTVVNGQGNITTQKAMVADRAVTTEPDGNWWDIFKWFF
jgi:hypothetical protein